MTTKPKGPAKVENVKAGGNHLHWQCSDCMFWSPSKAAVEKHIAVGEHLPEPIQRGTPEYEAMVAEREELTERATALGIEIPDDATNEEIAELIAAVAD